MIMSDIVLKELTIDDIELVRNWRNSKEVTSYMYDESYISEEQQKIWFENINWDKSTYWIIEYNGKKLGLASLNSIDKTLQSCYWAFYLGDSSVRGAGIGAKVEYNVINYVFDELNLNKLRCEVFIFNANVIKMHEKFGFRREAYYREHCMKDRKFNDVVGLALLKSEWMIFKSYYKQKIYGK